ncbi:hypothetical protein [uncultured Acidaminococcus sp.]|uniref:hypothetical protein n=1 Tax=uncultured Acidaminococcus sp. TaxID=352152 RepID=UPI0029422FA7|nr:hypothetical protein [uncultured Acidaminococcus sp.]
MDRTRPKRTGSFLLGNTAVERRASERYFSLSVPVRNPDRKGRDGAGGWGCSVLEMGEYTLVWKRKNPQFSVKISKLCSCCRTKETGTNWSGKSEQKMKNTRECPYEMDFSSENYFKFNNFALVSDIIWEKSCNILDNVSEFLFREHPDPFGKRKMLSLSSGTETKEDSQWKPRTQQKTVCWTAS